MTGNRSTLPNASNHAQMNMSRATVREFDDHNLMQVVKHADVHFSETPSDFERWQMVGITATPLKQDPDDKQQNSKSSSPSSSNSDDWNHDQPQGKAAEAVMMYLGSRAHPVAMVDDRRVRPYDVPEGGSAFYAATGTGQMLYHNDDGSYLVSVNNPKYGKDEKEKDRFASLRHVAKTPQERKIEKGSKAQDYKHEGETVNTEVRSTEKRIEFRVGDTVVGYYDKASSTWVFIGTVKLGSEDAQDPVYGKNHTSGMGQITSSSGAGAVLIASSQPGPPTSLDTLP